MRLLVLALSNLLFPLAALGVLAAFALSPRRRLLSGLRGELGERFGGLSPEARARLAGRRVLWVHAASAGEVGAVAGLLERLKREPASPAVLLTCLTAAGREAASRLAAVDAAALAPLDCWGAVARFLRQARPYALVLVETELWPNMIALSRRSGLRVALVNGRITERSFARYRPLRALLRPFLSALERVAAQTEADAERFRALGAVPAAVSVAGNMKYDALKPPAPGEKAAAAVAGAGWAGRPLFVAGSTHPVEEEAVLRAYEAARALVPDLRLVIAPRHVERSGDLWRTLASLGIPARRWSEGPLPAGAAEPRALLLDTLGLLSGFYPLARVAFVGGTLVPVGGHNLLEPALAGVPVLFGPHTASTPDAARLLVESGGGARAAGPEELASLLKGLAADPERARRLGGAARDAARGLQGAVERTFERCRSVLLPA